MASYGTLPPTTPDATDARFRQRDALRLALRLAEDRAVIPDLRLIALGVRILVPGIDVGQLLDDLRATLL